MTFRREKHLFKLRLSVESAVLNPNRSNWKYTEVRIHHTPAPLYEIIEVVAGICQSGLEEASGFGALSRNSSLQLVAAEVL